MMDIQAEKIQLAKLLLETENINIIKSVREIFNKSKTVDFWDELTDEQKNEIDKASIEIEKGAFADYDSFMEKHR